MKRHIDFWALIVSAAAIFIFDIIFVILSLVKISGLNAGITIIDTEFKSLAIAAIVLNVVLLISAAVYIIWKIHRLKKPVVITDK